MAAAAAVIRDPLSYDVTVDIGGAPTTVHYEPSSPESRRAATWIKMLSAVRPPALLVSSYVRLAHAETWASSRFGQALVLDPLYFGGKRRGHLLSILGAYAAFAGLVSWRILRLGAGALRAAFWFASILLLGLPALWLSSLIETRRAWRWVRADAPEPPPPLLGPVAPAA